MPKEGSIGLSMKHAMLNKIKFLSLTVRYKLLMNYQSTTGLIPSKLFFLRVINNYIVTSRKAAGSIPDSIIRMFHCHNSSGHTTSLASTQRLTETSTSSVS